MKNSLNSSNLLENSIISNSENIHPESKALIPSKRHLRSRRRQLLKEMSQGKL